FIVEPGAYTIAVGPSSSTVAASGSVQVTTGNGGQPAGTRSLAKLTIAEAFDDYSNISGDTSDIELVSTTDELYSNEAVWLRQADAWLNYQDVRIPAGTDTVSVSAGADRTGSLNVYALAPGSPASALASATPVATIPLTDTRPASGLTAGLGIGPIAVRNSPFAGHQYPGSPQGQNDLDASGNAYKDAYVTPEYQVQSVAAAIPAGTWDIYVQTTDRGARLEWLQIAGDADTTSSVAISQLYSADSIRVQGGTLQLDAKLTPPSSVSPVVWSVSAPTGSATALATIDSHGKLTATGTANGKVVVKATSGGKTASQEILITNQVAANKVNIAGSPKTVEYPMMRTGASFGATDTISQPKGTNTQSVVFSERFEENPASYYLPSTVLTVPTRELVWSVADASGRSTSLATVNNSGVVSATGLGDGDVVVTATLKNNPDISVSRTLTLTNQTGRNPYRMVQTENFDTFTPPLAIPPGGFFPPATSVSTWGAGANETGQAARTESGTTLSFREVDFRQLTAAQFAIRLATDTAATATPFNVRVWADAANAAGGGTLVASVSDTTDTSTGIYHTYVAPVATALTGKHDLFLVFDAGLRVNWWTFATDQRIDDEAAALLASVQELPRGANPAAGWSAFTDARTALAAALASAATSQTDLDRAQAGLTAALGAIEIPLLAQTGAIRAAIDAAGALTQGDYTPATWTAFAAALAQAKAVAALPYPVQSQVDAAYAALIAAIGALTVPVPSAPDVTDPVPAAKAALRQLIGTSAVLAGVQDQFVASTWAAYTAALTNAGQVLADPNATAAQVGAASAALAAAIGGLVRLPVPVPEAQGSPTLPPVRTVTAVRTSQPSIRLVKGSKAKVPAVAYGSSGSASGEVTWKSSKPSVVRVNAETGQLKALRRGSATLTATSKASTAAGKALTTKVKVTVVAKKVGVTAVRAAVPATVKVGATKKLNAKIAPARATGAEVRFYSSKPSVVAVDDAGTLTGVKAGKATITVSAGGKSKAYKVSVK
ncbi:MAG: Ig-like domain-containing protein, partial [Bifidobacteriaceae bacterium]|nr:Ig-like domain-containing protein [Bifidobacteriaceae bacterium]